MSPPEKDSGPLLYEELHRTVKELQPTLFDGIKLTLNKPLSSHLQLSHSLSMGLTEGSYKFGANYMGTKQVSPNESYPVMASEIQPDGQMNANFIHLLTPRLKTRIVGSFAKNQCLGSQMSLEYKANNFSSTLTAANIDLVKNNGVLVGQLLHRFSNSVTIGPEMVFQYGSAGHGDNSFKTMTQLSLAGRYSEKKYQLDATLSMGGVHLSYFQKASDDLQFGAEMMSDVTLGESIAGAYYQYELPKSHTIFKGSVDTSGNVGATVEKRFFPLPISLMMSALMMHAKNSTRVGLGLTVG